uniref:Putative ovule protein n=1 Tax=Solanum chacoense TaxID=4108 RepID=A0A0V0HS14_SOLCH
MWAKCISIYSQGFYATNCILSALWNTTFKRCECLFRRNILSWSFLLSTNILGKKCFLSSNI